MERTVDINGISINYDVTGSGKPLILMHGWGCDHSTVASVAAAAAQTHTVYNIDLPGFGKSPEPSTVWGVDDYTRMIEAFVRQLGLEKPSLAGHSFGGRVAIMYASRNDVDKLILIDAAGVKPRRSLKFRLRQRQFKIAKRLVQLLFSRPKAEEIIENMRRRRGSSDYASASPRMRAIMSRTVNEDLCGFMPSIKAPTLLIWGENDTATPIADARKMEKLIPDAGLVSFPGCGHYSFLDNPRQFAAVINSYLKSS